jgi:hypothetical protein
MKNWCPREALNALRAAALIPNSFPPPGAARLVSDAIRALKAQSAAPEEVAEAEEVSVLLYRFEVATWGQQPTEVSRVLEAIANRNELSARDSYSPQSDDNDLASLQTIGAQSRLVEAKPTDADLSERKNALYRLADPLKQAVEEPDPYASSRLFDAPFYLPV